MDNEHKLRSYLKKSMAELLQARSEIEELRNQAAEPIAIIGMACRYPGDVDSPEDLWHLLSSGRDAVTALPRDRGWELVDRQPPDAEETLAPSAYRGGFLARAADFDAAFFGISPREATVMDPQQRILLEASWEVLERAGVDPRSVRGTDTGVYVGVTSQDYHSLLRDTGADTHGYFLTGNNTSVVSGRVAYVLGLEGPAVTVDTACSSSLSALHQAVRGLRAGESSLALAGGVTVMSTPVAFEEFARMGGLAPGGRCRAFADTADGIVWAEGAGVLLLERLSDARANGHHVLALVRGSALNQDGASNTLSAPNGPSQERVIRAALASAGLSPADVDMVEAHGTGTRLGDPIEAQALQATYGQGRTGERPLWLGSLKSNIGHSQAAAGVAGVIKAVLAMRNGVMPRTLHADRPSTHVDWDSGGVRLLTGARPWTATGRPRRAAVSSFGISGTNAHVVLEEAPADQGTGPAQAAVVDDVPWVLSGHTGAALRDQARRLASFTASFTASEPGGGDPVRVGRALVSSRSSFGHRAVILPDEDGGHLDGLDRLAADEEHPDVIQGTLRRGADRVVFAFPGQGGQWRGMAGELLETSPVFAASLRRCAEALAPHTDWSLLPLLRDEDDPGLWDRLDVVQPALFAVMVSLAQVWKSMGVTPSAVVGHSQGEIAAAVVAGCLPLDDGARVVALRAGALRELAGSGGMVSLAVSEEHARKLVADTGAPVSLAVVNGPASVVVSGASAALDAVTAECGRRGVTVRRIDVDYASHSEQVAALREPLLAALSGLSPREGDVPFHSTVTGRREPGTALDAAYWYENLRRPVRFEQTVRTLLADGCRAFVECGTHPVLLPHIDATAEAAASGPVAVVGTLRRGLGGMRQVLGSAARLFVEGGEVDWASLFGPPGADPLATRLPTYAFQRQRYWPGAPGPRRAGPGSLGLDAAAHPLLGAVITRVSGDGVELAGRLSLAAHPWLADHRVSGQVLFPGTGLAELALHAGRQVGACALEELTLITPLVVPEEGGVRLRVAVGDTHDGTGMRTLTIHSRPEGEEYIQEWTRHAEGLLAPGAQEPSWEPSGSYAADRPTGTTPCGGEVRACGGAEEQAGGPSKPRA